MDEETLALRQRMLKARNNLINEPEIRKMTFEFLTVPLTEVRLASGDPSYPMITQAADTYVKRGGTLPNPVTAVAEAILYLRQRYEWCTWKITADGEVVGQGLPALEAVTYAYELDRRGYVAAVEEDQFVGDGVTFDPEKAKQIEAMIEARTAA